MVSTRSILAILSACAAPPALAQASVSPTALDMRIDGPPTPRLVAKIAEIGQPERITLGRDDTIRQIIEARCGIVDTGYLAIFLEENRDTLGKLTAKQRDEPLPGTTLTFPYCLSFEARPVALASPSVSAMFAAARLPLDAKALQDTAEGGKAIEARELSSLASADLAGNLDLFLAANRGFTATEYARRFAFDNPDVQFTKMQKGAEIRFPSAPQRATVPLRSGFDARSGTDALQAVAASDGATIVTAAAEVAQLISNLEVSPADCPGADGNPDWPIPQAAFREALAINRAGSDHAVLPPQNVLIVDTGYFPGMTGPAIPAAFHGRMRGIDPRSLYREIGVNTASRVDDPTPLAGLPHASHGGEVAATLLGGRFLDRTDHAAHLPKVVFASVAQSSAGGPFLDVGAIMRAYRHAVGSKIPVINTSLSATSQRDDFEFTLKALGDQALLVTAAGNVSGPPQEFVPGSPYWPGALGGNPLGAAPATVISVGAHDPEGRLLAFSREGEAHVDLLAPGCRIPTYSFDPASGAVTDVLRSGTSYAAPIVSMVAAKLSAEGLAPAAIKDRLIVSADVDERLHARVWSGGRLNIAKALSISHDFVEYGKAQPDGTVVRHVVRGELLNRHDAPLICGVQVQLGALRKLALSRDPTGARPPIWRGWRMNPNAGALSRIERLAACSVMPSDAFLAIRNREGGAEVRIPLPEIIDFVARYPG
ncbi:S8/S53 family peptidase [Sphingopyxis sp. RIFCSPHIGHO2_12_FULL_65_19]|uniref:S8/S53 family peptidase n=1 Tax=Sphingopyxis sp. RIFCSPHIGHO2_12_FULL_65_19 TaxID=1802172 RepID=UPI0025F83B43|nr:S8/S53 family peptidase [Sphingopyxis sp. RIFCSPHIGHO2_12_FULL_65_19]